MSDIKQAAIHAAETTLQAAQKVVENPKTVYIAGPATTAAGLSANDIAVWLGICVSAVVLYNQIMIAYRDWKKNKSK